MRVAAVVRWLRRSPPVLAPDAAYAVWAETYAAEPHNAVMLADQRALVPMIVSAAPRRAADVGTGTGRYLPVIAAAGAHTVVGVDRSPEMLGRQDGRWPRIRGDATHLPFRDACFDLVVSSLMLGDVEDLDAWIREAARVLAPGGHLVYSDFHPSWRAARWQRTFRARDGRTFRVPHHPHALAAHVRALESCGFEVRTVREPRLSPADAPDAGPSQRDLPVVLAIDAIRQPRAGLPFAGG